MHKGAVFILVMEILKRDPFFIDCLSNRDFMVSVKYRHICSTDLLGGCVLICISYIFSYVCSVYIICIT